MESNLAAGGVPARSSDTGFDRGAAVTRALLGWGVVAGPFYLTVGLVQAFVREGFNLARHPLSLLANGPGGWVQTANFGLSGLMVIAAAVGFRRVLRSGAVSWFLGGFGAAMIAAAIFRADPVDGFPAGTPEGLPTSISTPGLLHFVAGTLGFVSLAVAGFLAARAMSRRGVPALARLSFFSGLAVLLGFFGGMVIPGLSPGTAGIWFSVIVGWAWLAVLSLYLYRAAPDPNCDPPSR